MDTRTRSLTCGRRIGRWRRDLSALERFVGVCPTRLAQSVSAVAQLALDAFGSLPNLTPSRHAIGKELEASTATHRNQCTNYGASSDEAAEHPLDTELVVSIPNTASQGASANAILTSPLSASAGNRRSGLLAGVTVKGDGRVVFALKTARLRSVDEDPRALHQ
jgi:hypothetical protein